MDYLRLSLPKFLGKLPSRCVLRSSQGEGLLTVSLCYRGHPEAPVLRLGSESKGIWSCPLQWERRELLDGQEEDASFGGAGVDGDGIL